MSQLHVAVNGASLLKGEVGLAELRTLVGKFRVAHRYLSDAVADYAYDTVLLPGNVRIDDDLDLFAAGLSNLIITGSLRIDGLFRDSGDPQTAVFVLGDLEAGRLITAGALCVGKNLIVRNTLIGYSNDHIAEIHGDLRARDFVPENHSFDIGGELVVERVYGAGADSRVPTRLRHAATPVPDDELRNYLVPEVLNIEDYGDPEETPEIDLNQDKLREWVFRGTPIRVC